MIIEELHIVGFGKWRQTTFAFAPGINLVVAPNEAGKSTLLQALFASLYGLKRDFVRVTRYLDEYDTYKPWDGSPYETVVRYRIGGEVYRLHRRLEKERELSRLYREPELTDVTRQFAEDRRREYNFLEKQIGLNRTLFADVTWVRRAPLQTAGHHLSSLVKRQEADPLVGKLLYSLDQELAAIGKQEGAETTLLGKACKQLRLAEQTLAQAEANWQSIQGLTRFLAESQEQLDRLQRRQSSLQRQLQELQREEQEWQHWWVRSFETKTSAELAAWEQAAATQEERWLHAQTRQQMEELEEQLRHVTGQDQPRETAEARNEDVVRYLDFSAIPEAEWDEWLKGWYALSVFPDEAGEGQPKPPVDSAKLQADYRALLEIRKRMEELRERKYQLKARAAAADHTASTFGMVGSRAKTRMKSRVNGRKLIYSGAAALALSAAAIGWFWDGKVAAFVAGGALALLVAAWMSAGSVAVRERSVNPQRAAGLWTQNMAYDERELQRCEEELRELEEQLSRIVGEWGQTDWESFLHFRDECLAAVYRWEAGRRERDDARKIQARLELLMLRWGVPAHLSFREAAELVLREHSDWTHYAQLQQERLEQELAAERERRQLTDQAAWARSRKEEIINRWEADVRQLLAARQEAAGREKRRLEEELREVEETVMRLRERMAEARGEIGQRDSVPLARAQSEYDLYRQEAESLAMKRDALLLAKETLLAAIDEWQREVSPSLNETAAEIAGKLTDGRYQDVRLDPLNGFAVRLAGPGTADVIEHSRVSSGTQDQLYFAQRLALLTHLSREREPLPVFLDDHFSHYDQKRLEAALRYLVGLAENHQVFLFSCQDREFRFLQPLFQRDGRHQFVELA